MQPLYDLIRPYWPVLLAFVVAPLVGAAINWLLWWDTPQRWDAFAAAHPSRARTVRLLRAIFPHLRKLLVAGRERAAAATAPGASVVVTMLSPPVGVLAEKAGAVAVSETRPSLVVTVGDAPFDPAQRQEIAPDVVAEAQRITRERDGGA